MDVCFVQIGLRTPKNIALAQVIHHLIISKHLINILSKLGHCISYNELHEVNNYILKKPLVPVILLQISHWYFCMEQSTIMIF